jgi:hypothetical protein
VRIIGVTRIEEMDEYARRRAIDSDHGRLYAVASASFEHEELSAATREVRFAFRLTFSIEPVHEH